jgi:hypothetical protein
VTLVVAVFGRDGRDRCRCSNDGRNQHVNLHGSRSEGGGLVEWSGVERVRLEANSVMRERFRGATRN